MPSFKQNILIVIICIIYIILGVFLQKEGIIVHPAYWAFYGSLFGAFMTGIALWDHIKDD